MDEFWATQCPRRGPGLSHTKSRQWPNKCKDCGLVAPPVSQAPPPPIDVTARLKALGLIPEHSDDELVEPRYFTPVEGRADPELTPHEMFALAVNVVELERRRGYR